MEKEIKVISDALIQVCDRYKIGEMVQTGKSFANNNRIEHACSRCGFIKNYTG